MPKQASPAEPDSVRLNKFLALELGLSRRQADDLIKSGKVKINQTTAQLGARIFENKDKITVNQKPLKTGQKLIYILFNKPVGYICSRKTQGDAPTIYSLLPPEFWPLKPVGRLDKNSSGLLLLTNDGDFAHRMTHPSFRKQKLYLVKLDKDLQPLHQQMISDFGINLDDGKSKLSLERLKETSRREWRVQMSEGRNRQIRRTFKALGYQVERLHRTNFGNYALGDIKRAEWRKIKIS